jgi:hypothetical protein
VDGGPERRLGHANDRNAAEFCVNMRAQTGPALRIQVNVAIDHDQLEPLSGRDDGPQRR